MPAPKRPNTAAATAAVRRRGDETAAARLREHGWLVLPPEVVAGLPAEVAERVNNLSPVLHPSLVFQPEDDDSCTCPPPYRSSTAPDPACPVHQGRRAVM